MPTITQIAAQAGVSRTSAWLALNNKDGVSDELRYRVQDAMRQLNGIARSSERASLAVTRSILLLHSAYLTSTEYFKGLLRGIQSAATDDGIQLRVTAVDTMNHSDSHISEVYFSDSTLQPSGIITLSSELTSWVAERANNLRIPLVEIGYPHDPEKVSFVSGNEIAAGEMAARHLLNLGHRAIAFIGHMEHAPHLKQRIEGYRRALRDCGIEPRPEWMFFAPELDIWAVMTQFIDRKPPVTAVLFVNSYTSIQGLEALHDAGYKIPEDLSIIVFDDFEHARTSGLTTVAYPLEQIGSQAVRTLIMHLNEPLFDVTHHLLHTSLVLRASSVQPHTGEV